jgi:hypothetical protein
MTSQHEPAPAPSLNGGLYTGEPFAPDAPWRNIPVVPDATYLTRVNLLSANPPPGATEQIPGGWRPGNNSYPATPMVRGNHCLN